MDLSGCKDISVYLGTACNFDCSYCDRGYIKKIGNQRMTEADIPGLRRFFEVIKTAGNNEFPAELMSFHGGEPFAFVSVMDRVIEEVTQVYGEFPVFVQTNGSLVLKHRNFVARWSRRLQVSISYDFLFQEESRTAIDIDSTLAFLNEAGVKTQIQVVLPIDHPRVFSMDMLQAIVKLWAKHRFSQINLIPMRHFRGGDKFRVIVDDIQAALGGKRLHRLDRTDQLAGVDRVDALAAQPLEQEVRDLLRQRVDRLPCQLRRCCQREMRKRQPGRPSGTRVARRLHPGPARPVRRDHPAAVDHLAREQVLESRELVGLPLAHMGYSQFAGPALDDGGLPRSQDGEFDAGCLHIVEHLLRA